MDAQHKPRHLMFLPGPAHQGFARFHGDSLLSPRFQHPKAKLHPSRAECREVIRSGFRLKSDVADKDARLTQGDGPEQPRLQRRIGFKLA